MSTIISRRRTSIIGENFYFIFIALAFLSMYFGIRNGVISSLFIVVMTIDLVRVSYIDKQLKLSSIALWIVFFVIYNILTIIFAILGDYPFSVILSEGANSILPIMFFFYAKNVSLEERKSFEKKVVITALILIITGIYYNITLNDPYYIAFLDEAYPNFSMIWFQRFPRLTSWVGSVNIGVLLNVTIGFAFVKFVNDKKFKSLTFWVLVLSSGIVLSMQRSAFFVLAMNLFFIFAYLRKNKYIKRFHITWLVIILIIFVLLATVFMPSIISDFSSRLMNISSVFSERSSEWSYAFENGFMTITGMGLATGGQRAIGLSNSTINDGNYFKMIYEIGLIGFAIFIIIVLLTISLSIKKIRTTGIYLIIISGFLIQAIGSNILTFQFVAPLFWYCIGIIDKKQ